MFSWFGMVSFVPYTKVHEFAVWLKEGRLMGSVCKACGHSSFPPRADCPECLSEEFAYREWSGRGSLYSTSTIAAAPTGFEQYAPYRIGLVELEEGGRLLAWIGESLPAAEAKVGAPVQVVPRILGEHEELRVLYTIERPGTSWGRSPFAP